MEGQEVVITEESFPAIFRAFREIDYDTGAVTRDDPEQESYTIPARYTGKLKDCESALASLSADDLVSFCCGNEEEANSLLAASDALRHAHSLLDAYFDGWPEDEA